MAQVTYVIYARPPLKGEDHQLRAKIIRPDMSGEAAPVLVWLHAGDFRSGGFQDAEHDRLALDMAELDRKSVV